VRVVIDNRSGVELALEGIEALALFTLAQEQAPDDLELSVSLVTREEIRHLNRDFRAKDATTDVLSFECDDIGDAVAAGPASGLLLLGDVVIALEVVREHAADYETTFEAELALVLVHGILHLLGYDHLEDDEAAAMEAREDQLLGIWAQRCSDAGED
jgi:probable rRNA maturation factor